MYSSAKLRQINTTPRTFCANYLRMLTVRSYVSLITQPVLSSFVDTDGVMDTILPNCYREQ